MTDFQPDIAALRVAAQQREWNTLQDTLKRLLTLLEPMAGLEIAAVRIHQHLPRFEHYYPEAGWVRELVLGVVSYAVAPKDLPNHAVNQFPSPGCGNYVSAVLDLARTVQPGVSPFERYSFITNAIANTILAELMDTYYSTRPDLWQRLTTQADEIDPETGLTARQAITMQFWSDAEVAAQDTAAWLEIAEACAAKLDARYGEVQ
jgi:hypothetical protein